MVTKVSPHEIIVRHYETFYDHRTGRASKVDYAVMLGLPAALGVATWLADWRVVEFGQALAGVAILTGFAFGLLIFVFQLHVEVARGQLARPGGPLATLLGQLFANVGYAIIVGLAAVVFLVATGAMGPAATDPVSPDLQLGRVASAAGVALLTHFLLTLLMCVKRTWIAYDRMAKALN